MRSFLRSRLRSIYFALQGWKHTLCTQRNTWIHTTISVLVILLGAWLHLPGRDWAVILLTMALVWAAEFFNTALETLTDLVHPETHPLAKTSKDVSAAAVLVSAAAALLVGLLILGPPLWERLFH